MSRAKSSLGTGDTNVMELAFASARIPNSLEDRMNHPDLHRANLLVMHTDPIQSAGLVAALRQHPDFDVFVHGEHELPSGGQDVDAVIADYATAVRLTDRSVRGWQAGRRSQDARTDAQRS